MVVALAGALRRLRGGCVHGGKKTPQSCAAALAARPLRLRSARRSTPSDATMRSSKAAEWKGDGVMRSRSWPRGTVG